MQTYRRARSSMAAKKRGNWFFSLTIMTENMTTKIYFFFLSIWLSAIYSHSFSIKREAHRMRLCKYLKMQSWGLNFWNFSVILATSKSNVDVCFNNCSLNEDWRRKEKREIIMHGILFPSQLLMCTFGLVYVKRYF